MDIYGIKMALPGRMLICLFIYDDIENKEILFEMRVLLMTSREDGTFNGVEVGMSKREQITRERLNELTATGMWHRLDPGSVGFGTTHVVDVL